MITLPLLLTAFAGSVLTLLALLIGVPTALAVLAGWPLPHALPSVAAFGDAPARAAVADDASPLVAGTGAPGRDRPSDDVGDVADARRARASEKSIV